MAADVPLVVPEVNADHLALIEHQSWRTALSQRHPAATSSPIPTAAPSAWCSPSSPLEARFGIESLFVSTMQAVSGAGYPGVASLDILGNVVPFIKNEEEKLQEEVGKLLGRARRGGIQMLDAKLSAHCNRVAVEDGHTECVSIKLRKPGHARADSRRLGRVPRRSPARSCPSAPDQPVEFDARTDRPQPRLDRMRGNGMAATVGRLRECNLLDWKFVVLSHNTIRGPPARPY